MDARLRLGGMAVGGHENYQSVLLRATERNAMPTQVAAFERINTELEVDLDVDR